MNSLERDDTCAINHDLVLTDKQKETGGLLLIPRNTISSSLKKDSA